VQSGKEVSLERSPGGDERRVERLLAVLKQHDQGRHVVLIRGYPDPDSLASAWAHAWLCSTIGIECDMAHMPLVSRAENRAMVKLLELPLVRVAGPEDLSRYVAMSLVDANSIELAGDLTIPCISIVDHHSVSGKLEAPFIDIRVDVGSTSTIYTEYLVRAGVHREASSVARRLATALAYGIRSDTDDLLRATPADMHAMAELVTHLDADILAQLSRYSITVGAMRIIRRALEAMQIEGTWAVAGVGHVAPQDRDAIGQAADFLLRRDGVRTAITYGLVNGWIDGSLRTNDPAVDPAAWLRDAFGVGHRGVPYGGGRRGKGGFQIPLGPIASCPNERALWRVVKEMVEHTVLRRIGPSPAEEEEDHRVARHADLLGSGRLKHAV